MEELWKPVPGFEGRYEVSSFGRFRALSRQIVYSDGRVGTLQSKLIRGSLSNAGYYIISFDSNTKRLAHRVIAEAFLGVPEYRTTINHKDGNKTNNRVDNLEWCTQQHNNQHARATGLNKQHGERSNLAKYSDQFIQAIRNVYQMFPMDYETLGKLFGITGCHARQIVLNQTRKLPTSE